MTYSVSRYSNIQEIVGDILKVRVPHGVSGPGRGVRLGDLAYIEDVSGAASLAQVINIDRELVALQVFQGTKGLSTKSAVRFAGHPMQATYSDNILGRVFRGSGEPLDAGPELGEEPKVPIGDALTAVR